MDLPGTTFNQLLGVNNKGQQAGYFQDAGGLQHAYVHEKDGSFSVLNISMTSSQATGLNDQGVVVGFEQTSPTASSSSGFMLLRKLGTCSRRNHLYQAFAELGRVIRIAFLLEYLSSARLREQITASTNKVEAYTASPNGCSLAVRAYCSRFIRTSRRSG